MKIMKELLKNLEEMSIKSLIVGFVMFIASFSLTDRIGVIFLAFMGVTAIFLLLSVATVEKFLPWRYFFASLIGFVILVMMIAVITKPVFAKYGVVFFTDNPIAQFCVPISLTVLFLSPLVLLLWHEEEEKTKWYMKLFGIIFCWIVFALLLGLYVAL